MLTFTIQVKTLGILLYGLCSMKCFQFTLCQISILWVTQWFPIYSMHSSKEFIWNRRSKLHASLC